MKLDVVLVDEEGKKMRRGCFPFTKKEKEERSAARSKQAKKAGFGKKK